MNTPINTSAAFPIDAVMDVLQETMPQFPQPLIDDMGATRQTPFRILIATILSLRTKDTLTAVVAPKLFAVADTPAAMLALSEAEIAALIYPVGFYRNKARSIREVSALLLERHAGAVPDDLDALLALPGVGRKTANLVLTMGFGAPGIWSIPMSIAFVTAGATSGRRRLRRPSLPYVPSCQRSTGSPLTVCW